MRGKSVAPLELRWISVGIRRRLISIRSMFLKGSSMAWLQAHPVSGKYHIGFRFGGKKFRRSLNTSNPKTARRKLVRLEETIELIESGRIELPLNIDLPTFLLSDGKLNRKHTIEDRRLAELFDLFFESLPNGSLEPRTIDQMRSHRVHLEDFFGAKFLLANLSFSELQDYIAKRSMGKGIRGRTTNSNTIKKEIVTLRSLWKWCVATEAIPKCPFPSNGLRYPKTSEMPIFQTFSAVESQTRDLDPESHEAKDLWSSVFLNQEEVEELLDHVEESARHSFIYPMFVFAAHTGARRGEILRSEVNDIGSNSIAIRERKRKKRTNSMRHVPMSSRLKIALKEWFAIKPSSKSTFCNSDGRCKNPPGSEVSIDQSNDHFRTSLNKSRFKHLRGWHTFRHSFCSNCAAQGIDQRVIDEWVGHTTEEMRRRYRHLFPNKQQQALQSVFG